MNSQQTSGIVIVFLGLIIFTGLASAYIPALELATIGGGGTTSTAVITSSVVTTSGSTHTVTVTRTATTSVTCSPPIIYSTPAKCPKTIVIGGGPTVSGAEVVGAVIAALGLVLYLGKRVPSV